MPVVAGTCSSRIVFNVPDAHSTGVELELTAAPTDRFDFGISASYTESEIDSSVTSTERWRHDDRGRHRGGQPPAVRPGVPAVGQRDLQLADVGERVDGFITGVYQHVGSRYTQIADQADGFGTFADPRLTATRPSPSFTFDPLLPAYDIGNLRFGVRGDDWEAALFVNNVADENARLGLDQERGRVARVGYLVNQPRTYGISFRKDFGHDEPAAAPPPPPPPPPPAPPPPPPPPPPPGDQDKDGVTDDKDRCPNTTPGVAVDDIGCFREVTLRGLLFDTDSAAVDRGRHEPHRRGDRAVQDVAGRHRGADARRDRRPHRQHGCGRLQPGPVRAAREPP